MREIKKSDIGWSQNIPKSWSIVKFKNLVTFRKGLNITKEDLVENGVPVISYGQIHSKLNTGTGLISELERFVPQSYLETNSNCLVRLHDFIFADTSEDYEGCGNCAYIDKDSTIFAGYHTIIASSKKDQDNRYFAYQLLTDGWRDQIRSKVWGIKVFSITRSLLANAYTILPPFQEQVKIADHLDIICNGINRIISNTQATINGYKELKQSFITESVTKGIRGTRIMKDSGITWIPVIPNTWSVQKGSAILSILNRPVKDDDGIITCFRDGEVTLRSNRREDGFTLSDKEIGYQGVEPGDLVVHGMDGFAGSIGISDSRGKATPVLNVLDSSQNKYFLVYLLRSMAQWGVFLSLSTGIRVRSCDTNWNKLKNIQYIIPPIEEQKEIVDFLEKKCSTIDALIHSKELLMKELIQYKKSIITDYVTGKKKVE